MQIALMTFEGELHKIAEWEGKTEHQGMYLRFPGQDIDHYNAVLAIKPEDVEEYTKKVKEYKDKISNIQSEMIQYKARIHHKLIPFKN